MSRSKEYWNYDADELLQDMEDGMSAAESARLRCLTPYVVVCFRRKLLFLRENWLWENPKKKKHNPRGVVAVHSASYCYWTWDTEGE